MVLTIILIYLGLGYVVSPLMIWFTRIRPALKEGYSAKTVTVLKGELELVGGFELIMGLFLPFYWPYTLVSLIIKKIIHWAENE